MQKKLINPWKWQENRNYEQAIETIAPQKTLYISGQAAIDENGISSNDEMNQQLITSIKNLEKILHEANYPLNSIVKLTVYTVSLEELYPYFHLIQDWIKNNQIKTALTVLEVKGLFETLKIELDATAVN